MRSSASTLLSEECPRAGAAAASAGKVADSARRNAKTAAAKTESLETQTTDWQAQAKDTAERLVRQKKETNGASVPFVCQ